MLGPLIVFDMYRKLFISEEVSSFPPSRYSSVQSVSEVGSSLAEDHDSDSKYNCTSSIYVSTRILTIGDFSYFSIISELICEDYKNFVES